MRLSEIQSLVGGRTYGHYVAIHCPSPTHDDSKPSCMVYEDDFFVCLGCGIRGDHDYLLTLLGKNQKRVAPHRPQERTYTTPYIGDVESFCTKAMSGGHWYWRDVRGFSDEEIAKFQLGHADGWNTIPIRNRDYAITGVVLRASPWLEKAADTRYHIPYGQKPMLFTPDPALLRQGYCIITFGLVDALTLCAMNIPAVTTSGSGTKSFNPDWVRDWKREGIHFYIMPDKGERHSAVPLVRALMADLVLPDWQEGTKDAADYNHNRGILRELLAKDVLEVRD